jgi:hypothetical protein
MKLSTDLPLSFDRGPGCQSSSVSHSVRCAAGNLDTPRNRGAADRALANARPVSPSASYLKRHQVTKCPGSRLGPRSSGPLTPATLRGHAAIRHPWRGGGSRGIHAARPTPRHLRSACTQVAICVVRTDVRLEARSRSTANTAVRLDAIPVGDAGGHDGTGRDSDDSGLSVADEPPDLPLSSHHGPGCRTTSAPHTGIAYPPNRLFQVTRQRRNASAVRQDKIISPTANARHGQKTLNPGKRKAPNKSGLFVSENTQ